MSTKAILVVNLLQVAELSQDCCSNKAILGFDHIKGWLSCEDNFHKTAVLDFDHTTQLVDKLLTSSVHADTKVV